MNDIDELLKEQLEDPEFKEAWDASELEDQLRRMIIAERIERNLTQKELAARAGIRQSNISRIESGSCVPTLKTLYTIARAVGKELKIEFV